MIGGHDGLLVYTEGTIEWNKPWAAKMTKKDAPDVAHLMKMILGLQSKGLTDVDLIATWVIQWIQPLQARDNPMWEYSGLTD